MQGFAPWDSWVSHAAEAGAPSSVPISPLVSPLVYGDFWPGLHATFSFTPAGSATDNCCYAGGSKTTLAWSAAQKDFVRAIFDHVATFTDLRLDEVPFGSGQDISFQSVAQVPGGWAGYSGTPSNTGGVHTVVGQDYLNPMTSVLIHEIGHALGLRHPHDGGFPGVTSSGDAGDFGLNSTLFTVMSYRGAIDPLNPNLYFSGNRPYYAALDIAALQSLYGVNTTYAHGNTVYRAGEDIQAIWDTGGSDTIDFRTAVGDCVIDLRAATLLDAPGGGGYASFVREPENWSTDYQVHGAYTIAHGVLIENGIGGRGADHLQGNIARNQLSGGMGADSLTGAGNGDILSGDAGNDLMWGGDGVDRLFGGSGADKLVGGAEGDVILGGTGADRMEGQDGPDVFRFLDIAESGTRAGEIDIITDFATAAGSVGFQDRIDLSHLDAVAGTRGHDPFVYIGSAGFTAAGQVRVSQTLHGAMVEVNVAGLDAADMRIDLAGVTAAEVGAEDFVL